MNRDTHPDPDVASVVARSAALLQSHAPRLRGMLKKAPDTDALPGILGQPPADLPVFYDVAVRLCDEGRFEQAIFPAIALTLWHPQEARYAFIAATAMQRLGQFALAMAYFAAAGSADGEGLGSATAFRIGECLEALGRPEEAAQAFDAAVDASRSDADMAHVQHAAQQRSDELRRC